MTSYLIQGSYGSLRYWVRVSYNKRQGHYHEWVGLIENASEFRKEEAESWIRDNHHKCNLKLDIVNKEKAAQCQE